MRMKWISIAILEWMTPVRAEGESRDVGEQRCWRPWTTKEPCVVVSNQWGSVADRCYTAVWLARAIDQRKEEPDGDFGRRARQAR